MFILMPQLSEIWPERAQTCSYALLTCYHIFWALCWFLVWKMLQVHLVLTLPSHGISHFSEWSLSFKWSLDAKVQVLNMLIIMMALLPLCSINGHNWTYPQTFPSIFISVCIYIFLKTWAHTSSSNYSPIS